MNQRQILIRDAVNEAARACGGRPNLYARLDVSSSWVYECIKKGGMPLTMAMATHLLTGGEYRWYELALPELEQVFKNLNPGTYNENDLKLAITALKNQ